jgi:hypothetical protein
MGRDSGQATDAFKLLKMFVKGKGPFEFERPHHGEACAVGKTEILVSVSSKNLFLPALAWVTLWRSIIRPRSS